MKTKFFYYLFLTITIGLTQISCSPEDGRDGEQGPPGEDGNANVMYSNWKPIIWNQQNDPLYKVMSIEEPLITQGFIDSGGVVLMYFGYKTGTTTAVFPLPVLFGNDYLYNYHGVSSTFSGVVVTVISMDNITPVSNSYVNPEYSIRYVIIPGGMALGRFAQQEWDKVDKNNYDEVAAFLGIRD